MKETICSALRFTICLFFVISAYCITLPYLALALLRKMMGMAWDVTKGSRQ